MSIPRIPGPARLIVSVLTPRKEVADHAKKQLVCEFGPIENEIGPLAFDFSNYYDKEMGPGIQRWMWVFSDLVDRAELVRIKCLTNQLEEAYTNGGKRAFNLDPGLMTLENFVLATGKNRANRIYLGRGIFADLTLMFHKASYCPLEWTYPDYAGHEMISVLNGLRENLRCRMAQETTKTVP